MNTILYLFRRSEILPHETLFLDQFVVYSCLRLVLRGLAWVKFLAVSELAAGGLRKGQSLC